MALFCAMASCGVLSKPSVPKLQPSDVGYSGPLEPTFYYLEGVKTAQLYNDSQRAIALFDRALEIDSLHTPSLYEAANTLMATNPAKAMIYSLKANKIDSTNLWYRSQLGRLMLLTSDYNKAIDTYEQLIKEAPQNPDNYRVLAALYEQSKQPFSAINILDSAEYKLGRIEELAAYKRELLIGVSLYNRAIAENQALINDFPYKYENYVVMAELYAATGKDSLALVNYNKALGLNPLGLQVLASMNEYYKKKGDQINFLATTKNIFELPDVDLQTKIRVFNSLTNDKEFYRSYFFQINDLASLLLLNYPNEYNVIELYANHLIASGNLEQALTLYKGNIKDSINNIKIFNNILDMEGYLNRPDSVTKYSDMALARFPKNPDLYLRKGSIAAFLKQDKQAMQHYKSALKYATSDSMRSVVIGIIGDMHQQTNKTKGGGYPYYKRALALWPDNTVILNNYAYFLSVEGRDLDHALKMAQRVIELAGSNPTYLDTQAWILYKLGRYDEAKKIMQQAISLDRTASSELLIHYGDILYAMKEYFMASIYWNKAKEAGYEAALIDKRLKLIEGK